MRWQKIARLAIALFVLVFAIIVALALRRGKQAPDDQAPLTRLDPKAIVETRGGIDQKRVVDGKLRWAVKAATQLTYGDGRTRLGGGVEVQLPRGDRTFTITSNEADILPKDNMLKSGKFVGNVTLASDDGLRVTSAEADYDNAEGMVRVPGPVEFTKGRLKGKGVGATYDQNRDVLWLLANVHLTVAPDDSGAGAMEADAKSAGLAKPDHYVKLVGDVRIDSEGRVLRGDEVTIRLSEDDKRIQRVEQRGHSRIDGGSGGPQSMAANNIDLTYADDGRTLQFAKLMENASAQLAGAAGTGGKRVTGRSIDIALAPDGKTVTNLTSSERTQVDLPPEADGPSRRINADTLAGAGTPEGGLQEATFAGNVVFHETRPERRNLAAINRTARSLKLVTKTKPGFGAIEQAEFRGNFTFTDGQTKAEAPHAVYQVDSETINLSPSEDPGPPPVVSDGKIEVQARTIAFTTTGQKLKADTDVRSSMQPQKKAAAPAEATKLPSLLKDDETVFVTSNRLDYDGAASNAVYKGSARLWQGTDTSIRADTIVVDDKTGNLTATDPKNKLETRMMVEREDSKTKERKRVQQIGRAERFDYEDASRVATYTTAAYLSGPEGVVTAERIVLHLKEQVTELERAEAYEKVTLKEGVRLVQGSKMVYTAANDTYVITGPPVLIVEDAPPKCNEMWAKVATYDRRSGNMKADGADANTMSKPCTGKRLF